MGADLKFYRIVQPYYRSDTSRYYPGGSIVGVPSDEKPGRGWVEVEAYGEEIAMTPSQSTFNPASAPMESAETMSEVQGGKGRRRPVGA